MPGCFSEEDILELATGRCTLGQDPAVEAHLAACPACSALLAEVLASDWVDDARRSSDDREATSKVETRSLTSRRLGPYRLEVQIGAGGMGEVYRAWDTRLERPVAVKVLSARTLDSPEQVKRLEREARAAASIAHPNVVTVHDLGWADDLPFIVSELIEGESLRSLIDRGGVTPAMGLRLGRELARGLAAAHAKKVIHRDLNPRNIIVTKEGVLKILDFGLAKLTGEAKGRGSDETTPGTVLGTAGYLSPEQARGEPADHRSDIFAFGAILYEMMTGERAFVGSTFAERMAAVLRDSPAGLSGDTLGKAAPVIARCLEKEPGRRFQSADDLVFVLEALREGQSPSVPAVVDAASRQERPKGGMSRRALLSATIGGALGGALLGSALRPRSAPSAPMAGFSYHQLSFRHGRVLSSRITPDGGSILYSAAWDGLPPSLYTVRRGGGGTRSLELPPADVLAISSRGELALSLGAHFVEGFHTAGKLAVVPLELGEPRVLANDVQEADFTPDGKELAIVRQAGTGFRLELPAGKTLFETAAWLSHPRVSPDGKSLACLMHPSPYDDRGSLVLLDRATGALRVVSEGWASIVGLAWSRDGRELLFTAARQSANTALFAVSLAGRLRLLAQTTGRLRLHDVGSGGSAVVSHDNWRLCTMVRETCALQDRDMSLSDISLVADISVDGETLLVGEFGDSEGTSNGAYVRGVRGARPLRLGDGVPLSLSPDGRRVLALLPSSPPRLLVYSIGAGEALTIPLGDVELVQWARWRGLDDVVIGGAAAGRAPRIWLWRAGGVTPQPITDEGVFGQGHVSPDGAMVAFVTSDGKLLRVDLDAPFSAMVTPGRYVDELVCGYHASGLLLFVRTKALPVHIRKVDVKTGRSEPHAQITPPLLGLKGLDAVALSANGEAYVYSYGQELSRLYLIEAG